MSFSSEVKHEITTVERESCCERALLSAFIHINSNMIIANKQIQLQSEIENANIAKYIYTLLKKRYGVELELSVLKKGRFKNSNIYSIKVLNRSIEVLEDLGIYSSLGMRPTPSKLITLKECCVKSYLAGAFLASGSINAPSTANYHLELSTTDDELSQYILNLVLETDIKAKLTQRRSRHVVYIKAADHIADFLKIVGAHVKTLEFEDIRIQRDFKNSLTRLDNCEVANEMKSIKAGNKQIDAIQKLIEFNRFNYMEERLIKVANMRMQFPESSLVELLDHYEDMYDETISKSGLQHRFKKIIEFANSIEDKR